MILAVGNTKGGVGKTTIAVNLAILRTLAGQDVLLVDGDEQGSASLFSELRADLVGACGYTAVGLHGAATQLAACLAAARTRPLEPGGIAALSAAQDVLAMAWERAERDDAHDLAGPRLPETVTARRAQLAQQAHAATDQFNQAVVRYNEAIGQFPAVLLAWLFGFKPGRRVGAGATAPLA